MRSEQESKVLRCLTVVVGTDENLEKLGQFSRIGPPLMLRDFDLDDFFRFLFFEPID
jgi:hypothetical protein